MTCLRPCIKVSGSPLILGPMLILLNHEHGGRKSPKNIIIDHKTLTWDFSGGPVVKTLCFHCKGVVQALVGEQRSHMPHSQ